MGQHVMKNGGQKTRAEEERDRGKKRSRKEDESPEAEREEVEEKEVQPKLARFFLVEVRCAREVRGEQREDDDEGQREGQCSLSK